MTNLRQDMRKNYIALLEVYCADDNLINLIDHCIIDEEREREEQYLEKARYPEKRELLGKLKIDLLTRKKMIELEAERERIRGGSNEKK